MFKYSKKILAIALPAMAENVLQTLIGVVDSYLIAQLGLVAVSGVAVATNVLAVYQALFIALGTAVSSLIARQQNSRERRNHQQQALLLTLLVSLLLSIIAWFGGGILLAVLGIKGDILTTARHYLTIVGGGILGLGMMTTLGAIARAQGNVKLPMFVSFMVNALNALLSALSVFVWDFGITGVAMATVVSRVIGVLLLVKALPSVKLIKGWTCTLDKELISLSLPAAGERLMMRAGDIVVVSIVVQVGTAAVAGNAIGETLTQFNYLPGMSIATAVVILMGGLPKREQHQLIRTAYLLAVLMMLTISGGVLLQGGYLIRLFTDNSGAEAASSIVLLASWLGTFVTAGTLIYTAAWQGVGNAKLPFYATTIGMWVIRIGLGWAMALVLRKGLLGIWLATILDNFFRWLFLGYTYYKDRK